MSIQNLIRKLESSEVDDRRVAARTLAQYPSMSDIMERNERDISDAIGPLAIAIFDEDAETRKYAAHAIDAALRDQQDISAAIQALVRGLSGQRADLRRSATLILRNAIVRGLDADPIESPLRALLDDPDPETKWGAADALAYWYAAGKRWQDVGDLLAHTDPDVAQETAGTLAEFWSRFDYEPVAARLLALLTSESLELRLVAAKALVHHPQDASDLAAAFAVLLECLSNEEARIRIAAIRALHTGISRLFRLYPQIREQDDLTSDDWERLTPVTGALPAIEDALSDPKSAIQEEAIEALTTILSALPVNELDRYEELVKLFRKVLRSGHKRVREKAAEALTVLWVRSGRWDELLSLLADPSNEVKRKVLHTLAGHYAIRDFDYAPLVPAILALLSDPDSKVRYAASSALEKVEPSQLLGPLEREPLDTDTQLTLLKEVRAKVHRKSLKALKSMLKGKSDEDKTAYLTALLDHPRPAVRSWAAESLWWLGQGQDISAAIPPLTQLLADPDPACRREAANALGDAARHGSIEQAHTTLVELIQDNSAEVQKSAFRALWMSADYSDADLSPVMPTMFQIQRDDPDQEKRGEAAYVISHASKRCDLDAYVSDLVAALGDDFQRVRFYSARTFYYAAERGTNIQPAIPALARALIDEEQVAAWAVEVLLAYASDATRASEVLQATDALDNDHPQVAKVVGACEEQLAD